MYTISEGLFKVFTSAAMVIGVSTLLWMAWSVVKSAITKAKRTKPNYSDEVNRLLDMEDFEKEMYYKDQTA